MFVLQASRYSRPLAPVRDQLQGWLELRRLWCGKFPVAYVSAVPSFLGRGWCLGIGAVGWRLSLRWFPRWSRRWVELLRCKAPMRFGLLWRWWGIFHFGLWGLVTRKILNMPSTDCRCKTILTLMILHEFVMNLCLMYLMFRFFLNVLICPLTWSGDVRRCQEMSVLHSSSMAWRTEVVQFASNHRCRIFNRKPRRRNPWQRGVTRPTSGFAKAVGCSNLL